MLPETVPATSMIAKGGKICCPEPEPTEDVTVHGQRCLNAINIYSKYVNILMFAITERSAISDEASIRCLCPQDYYDRSDVDPLSVPPRLL